MASITLKGGAARNFMAELLVDQHGEKAREKCVGPMLAAVEAELKRRQTELENKQQPSAEGDSHE